MLVFFYELYFKIKMNLVKLWETYSESDLQKCALLTLDYFPLWIQQNRWAWKHNKHGVMATSFANAKQIVGMKNFFEYHFDDEKIATKYKKATLNYLSNHPEDVEKNCPNFKSTFPTILNSKLKKSINIQTLNVPEVQDSSILITVSDLDKLKDLIICGQNNKVKTMKLTKEGDLELDYK